MPTEARVAWCKQMGVSRGEWHGEVLASVIRAGQPAGDLLNPVRSSVQGSRPATSSTLSAHLLRELRSPALAGDPRAGGVHVAAIIIPVGVLVALTVPVCAVGTIPEARGDVAREIAFPIINIL